jgi:hypothetical protein
MMLTEHANFQDLASIMSLHNDYSSAEPFLQGEYDIRIQKIGNNYRAYRRIGTGSDFVTIYVVSKEPNGKQMSDLRF